MDHGLDIQDLLAKGPLGEVVKSAVDEVIQNIDQCDLPEHAITITITADPENVIPETGSGGWTESPEQVWIYVDPNSTYFQAAPKVRVKSAVAHELGHAFRERSVPFPGTLLDDLVAEGIADHFDVRFAGSEYIPWSTALSGSGVAALYERAMPLLLKREHDHSAWFMGSDTEDLPRWGGYALGFWIVATYLEKTQQRIDEVIAVPSEEFLSP